MGLTTRAAAAAQRSRRAVCTVVLAGAALPGCIVSDERCGRNQVEVKEDFPLCACAAGTIPDPRGYGCLKCGEHEEVVNGMCQCTTGFVKPSAQEPCQMATGGVLGAACSMDIPCADPYPYCASSGGQSFCTTQGCKANAECPPDWICSNPGADGFCVKPVGLGKPCQSSAECVGGEATYCETFAAKACIIEGCVSKPGMCPSGNVCCDLTGLIGRSVCTPSMVLMGGLCPDQKPPVSP